MGLPDAITENVYTWPMVEFTRKEVLQMIAAVPYGSKIRFSGFDLSGLDLHSIDLSLAILTYAYLTKTILHDATMPDGTKHA